MNFKPPSGGPVSEPAIIKQTHLTALLKQYGSSHGEKASKYR